MGYGHLLRRPARTSRGIAQAFLIGSDFVGDEAVALILGDNIFHGDIGLAPLVASFSTGAHIFGYPVRDPERYGVVDLDADGNVRSLVEKPSEPISNLAVPGLYLYDGRVVEMTEGLVPSGRGELEITDLNKAYLNRGELVATRLARGIAWLDSGTHESLLEASNFIATIEHRQGLKIACLEEIALRTGAISFAEFRAMVDAMAASSYREYLERVVAELV